MSYAWKIWEKERERERKRMWIWINLFYTMNLNWTFLAKKDFSSTFFFVVDLHSPFMGLSSYLFYCDVCCCCRCDDISLSWKCIATLCNAVFFLLLCFWEFYSSGANHIILAWIFITKKTFRMHFFHDKFST